MTPKFSYKNYLEPTPKNIQIFVETIQGGVVLAAGSVYILSNPDLGFWMMIGAFALDKLSKFFGRVANDLEKVSIEGKDLKVTKEPVETEPKT